MKFTAVALILATVAPALALPKPPVVRPHYPAYIPCRSLQTDPEMPDIRALEVRTGNYA